MVEIDSSDKCLEVVKNIILLTIPSVGIDGNYLPYDRICLLHFSIPKKLYVSFCIDVAILKSRIVFTVDYESKLKAYLNLKYTRLIWDT